MSRSPSFRNAAIALSASIVAGVALWVTRAALDFAGPADATQRVAMLPAWSELLGFIILMVLVTSAIGSLLQRASTERQHAPFWSATLSDTLMPVFGLSFLVLPYLPYVADWIPALRILAGPLRVVIWAIVIGQVLWILTPRLVGRQRGFAEPIGRQILPLAIALATFAASVIIFSRLAHTEHFTDSPVVRGPHTRTILWALMAVGACTAAVIWAWARAVTGSAAAATAAWAAVCLSPPFALNTLLVYPEGPLAFIVIGVTALAWRYRLRVPAAALYVLAALVSLGAWIFLTHGDTSRFDAGAFPVGMAGLVFDQEYGVVAYAPAMLLGFAGLMAMARDRTTRTTAAQVALVVIPFVALTACIDPWWSKSAMPGRLILPVFPLLAVPVAWCYAQTSERPVSRAAIQLLVLTGVVLTLTLAIAGETVPLPQEADGSSSVLQWMSHGWQLWVDAPSFVAPERAVAAVRTLLWLGAIALFAWLCRGRTQQAGGRAALRASVYAALVCLAAVSVSSAIPAAGGQGRFDPEGRVIFPMLETFDPVARPIAVRYSPLALVAPQDLPPLFSLTATPGQRRDRQPVRVVLNARFRLPAGEYVIDVEGSELAGTVENPTIALQLGREGSPVETWPLALARGGHWQRRFQVPLDSQFVGFRASRQVERMITAMRLTPVNVVETRRRFPAPVVRSAASFSQAIVFFHDGDAYAEPEGFWVKGRTIAQMTLAKKTPSNPAVVLAIHSGAKPNVVTLSTGRWSERLDLVPGVTTRIAVPSDATEQFIPLTVATSDGFVPAEVERGSRDRRLLGVWISLPVDAMAGVTPGDTSRTPAVP